MATDVLVIPVRNAAARWALAVVVLVASLVLTFVSARWAAAETIIYIAAKRPLPVRALEVAYALAPSNPETAFVLGTQYLDSGSAEQSAAARDLLAAAAREAPNRPRVWLAVGREREFAGDVASAERAFLRASDLVPSHWSPTWALGNFYLRQGRFDEAAPWLRRAVELNADLAPIATRTVWMATDKDVVATIRVFEGSTRADAAIVDLLVGEKRLDDALALWASAAKRGALDGSIVDQGRKLASALLADGRGAEVVRVYSTIDPAAAPAVGAFTNGSFDEEVSDKETNPFRWLVTQSTEARVSIDTGRTGGHALRIDYDSKGGTSFTHAAELVRLEPGATYTVELWAATNDLRTGGPPSVAVVDAANSNRVFAFVTLPAGTTEWSPYRMTFTAPPSGLASIRVSRSTCGPVCPVFGTLRIDDLTLSR